MSDQPIMPAFNVAIMHIVSKLLPHGFDLTDDATCPTLEALQRSFYHGSRPAVWRGESDNTIYGDAEVNWNARAWHDWHHAMGGYDFTLGGERMTAEAQAQDLIKLYGRTEQTTQMVTLLLTEVIGQAEFFDSKRSFPEDQRAFTIQMAPMYRRHAERLVRAEAGALAA